MSRNKKRKNTLAAETAAQDTVTADAVAQDGDTPDTTVLADKNAGPQNAGEEKAPDPQAKSPRKKRTKKQAVPTQQKAPGEQAAEPVRDKATAPTEEEKGQSEQTVAEDQAQQAAGQADDRKATTFTGHSGKKVKKAKAEEGEREPEIGFWQNAKERILSANPVYVKAIALVPILGAATTLKNGVMLSGVMILTVLVLNLILYPVYRYIPRGYRVAGAFLAAGIVITPVIMAAQYLAPNIVPLCGIYLPLLAVCALPMIEKKHYGHKYGIFKTLRDALFDALGFAFAAIVFSVIREMLGNGTLYDRPLPYSFKFSFAVLPAGGILLLGLLLALFRKIFHIKDDSGEGTK